MSMQKPKKSDVTYWMRNEESNLVTPLIYVLDSNNRVCMLISDFVELVVQYGSNCPENTTHFAHGCIQMGEATFKQHVKKLQTKYGVKFSIKTEWGTNADT